MTARPPPAPAITTATVAAAWPSVIAEPADFARPVEPAPATWREPLAEAALAPRERPNSRHTGNGSSAAIFAAMLRGLTRASSTPAMSAVCRQS